MSSFINVEWPFLLQLSNSVLLDTFIYAYPNKWNNSISCSQQLTTRGLEPLTSDHSARLQVKLNLWAALDSVEVTVMGHEPDHLSSQGPPSNNYLLGTNLWLGLIYLFVRLLGKQGKEQSWNNKTRTKEQTSRLFYYYSRYLTRATHFIVNHVTWNT